MKKFLISLVLLSSLTAYSKSALDFDFGDQQKMIDSVTYEEYKKYGGYIINLKNYEYHKKWKNKWEKMCGWWTDGSSVVVNIEKNKNNIYEYMLYKNKHYAEMNGGKIILNKREKDFKIYRDELKKKNKTLEEFMKDLEKKGENAKKEYNILTSNETIYTYDEPAALLSDEEGDLWGSSVFTGEKTSKNLNDKGYLLYMSPFTLTKDGKLFLKPLDKEPISYGDFVFKFGEFRDYLHKDYPTDRKVKGYIDYEFIANPLRKMTNEEIEAFKKKKIKHEVFKKDTGEWDPYYYDGATKTRIVMDYVD